MNNVQARYILDNLYCCDDRLGCELMGAIKWNDLKKAVANVTTKTVSKLPYSVPLNSNYNSINSVIRKLAKENEYNAASNYWNSKINKKKIHNNLAAKLFGFNDQLGEELLGGWWTDFKNKVAGATHTILEAGENIPVADSAVSRLRDIFSVVKTGRRAGEAASVAYEWWDTHKWTVIIGGGASLLIIMYLLGKSKGAKD